MRRPTTATTVELTPASFIKLDTPRIKRQTNRIEKDGRVKRKTATEMQAISRRKFATVIALTPGKRSIDPATTRPKTNAAAESIRLRQATCIGVAWNISRAISGTANTATCIPIAPHNSAPASTNTGLRDHFLLLFITKVDRHGVSFPRLTKVLLYLMIMVARQMHESHSSRHHAGNRSAQTLDHHRHRESVNPRADLVWQMHHFRVSLICDYLPSTQCGGIYQNQFSPGYGGSVSSIVRDHSCHETLSLPVILTTRMPSSPKCLNTSAFFISVVYTAPSVLSTIQL